MLFVSQPRLKERVLNEIATVSVPAAMKGPENPTPRTDVSGRVSWIFSDTYFWASWGSVTRYKQRMAVALMARDASAAEYEDTPYGMDISCDHRQRVRHETKGSTTLTVWECVYDVSTDREPAFQLLFSDRAQRLQIGWHGVKKEVDLNTALTLLPRIAASFKVLRDPATTFAQQRDAPRQEAARRSNNLSTVQAMLRREGYTALTPGSPVLRNGVYLEWMADPEPRYQLLVPLGKVRAPAGGAVMGRPRPVSAGNAMSGLAGTIGWREYRDDEWQFSNAENAYLPLPGIGAALASKQTDEGMVYFYYVATVRVEETEDQEVLTSLQWFLRTVPEAQRRWRAGLLVAPGKPEND